VHLDEYVMLVHDKRTSTPQYRLLQLEMSESMIGAPPVCCVAVDLADMVHSALSMLQDKKLVW
jgi:aminopeptidase C